MFQLLVNADGGLTTAGYAVSALAVILLAAAVIFFCSKNSSTRKMTTQQLVTCAVALALAYVTSYIKLFKLPFGGSVTLFSMLFIVLIGYWYGAKIGILTGLVYGIFQFLQEPYVLSLFQVCCDYILAFGAMGIAGFFSKSKKHGLVKVSGCYSGKTRIPRTWRIPVLDGLHAVQFPEILNCSLSNHL